MAYGEIYYKSINRGGHTVRLAIYKRDYSGSSKEIGDFCSFHLELQGSQATLETPIVKSSVVFSMIDSRDKADTSSVKYGAWEEFYTPDTTLYRVWITVDSSAIWTGYITPDSWEDDLRYRGRIVITARDMLGHLQDFTFDKSDVADTATNGMVALTNLLAAAFTKAEIPMSLNYYTNSNWHWLKSANSQSILNWAIDIASLQDKNWYEIVEDVLDSLGLTLRYTGRNYIVLCSIRDIPNLGYSSPSSSVVTKTPQFINVSGHRTLTPAYRQISESIHYDADRDNMETFMDSDFEQRYSSGYYRELVKDGWELLVMQNDNWVPSDGTLKNGMLPYNLTNNPFNDEVADKRRYVMLMHYPYGVPIFSYRRTVMVAPRVTATIGFQLAHGFITSNAGTSWSYKNNMYAGTLRYRIEWLQLSGGSLWLNSRTNQWEASAGPWYNYTVETDKATADVAITVTTPGMAGQLRVWFFMDYADYNTSNGVRYIRLGEFSVTTEKNCLPQGLTVNTIYDQDQNTTLKRNSVYGQVPDWVLTAGSITNGIYEFNSASLFPPVGNVKWNGSGTALPIQVFVHLQHIAFHAKANNILTGDIRDATSDNPNFNSLWSIFNRNFILVGGSYNLLTGIIEDAILMEFDTYESVCGSITANYTKNDVEGEYKAGQSEASVQVTGGGGGAGGTVTSVNVTVPTGLQASGGPIVTAGTIAITLASGYKIPTTTEVSNGSTAYGWGNHATQGYLKSITSTMITNALGYTPASSTVVTNLQTRMTNAEGDIRNLQAAVEELGSPYCHSAPKLKIITGVSKIRQTARDPVMNIEHPLIGKTGFQVVLMVYSRRRGRKDSMSPRDKSQYRSGWGEARGKLATNAPLLITPTSQTAKDFHEAGIILENIREHILHNYICGRDLSLSTVHGWTWATFRQSYSSDNYLYGFGALSNFAGTETAFMNKTKRCRLFGWAIRWTNPEFLKIWDDTTTLAETTRMIEDPNHQGRMVPRYIYSQVAPFRVFCLPDVDSKWTLGIQLQTLTPPTSGGR